MNNNNAEAYLREQQVPDILKSLVTQLCLERPDRPVKFMIDHLRQWYLPAETERYHTENYYGYKSATPITYGIHVNQRNVGGLQEANEASALEEDDDMRAKRGRGVPAQELLDDGDDDANKRQRRGAFCDAPASFGMRLDLEKFPAKPADVVEVLERAARANPLLKKLERDDRLRLYRAMFPVQYRADDTIIREGDQGDNFYIISEGECVVYVRNVEVVRYKAGDSFGELALIHGTPRQATVVALTDVTVWGLERTAYRASLMRITIEKRERYGVFLQNVPLLSGLDRYDRLMISDCLEPIDYQDGDVILRQGDVGNSFFLIVSGTVRVVQKVGDSEGVVGMLGPGDYFGEIALLTDSTRQATCIAEGPVKCVYMQREDFERVMGPVKNYVKSQIPMYKRYLEPESKEADTREEK